MKVRIIKATKSDWYFHQIGSVLEVVEYEHDDKIYRISDVYGNGNGINKSDCKIVLELEETFKPRIMAISDVSIEDAKKDIEEWLVVGKDIVGRFISYQVDSIDKINDETRAEVWRFAVDIEEQAPEFTAEQVAYLDKHYIKK